VFGDLMDRNSKCRSSPARISRRYWVFGELNTKPGVTYLKKVTWNRENGSVSARREPRGSGHLAEAAQRRR